MATPIRRILVAIGDLHYPPRNELRKAAELARATNAIVELFHAADVPVPADHAAARLRAGLVARQALTKISNAEDRLQRFAQLELFRGIKVNVHSNADYPPHEAIIRRASRIRADLVIAATRPRGFAKRLWLRNLDWELIRQCPCPLLLVKSSRPYAGSVVLAAVDPFHAHAKPANLDTRLLDVGSTAARLFKGSLHVLHVYTPLVNVIPLPVAAAVPVLPPPEAEQTHAQVVASELARLAKSAGVPARARHLRMGVVADELCSVARSTRAALLVMGAVSRSALGRIFIGSTAERALDQVTCDVLVVKPRAFKSSVKMSSVATSARAA